MRHINHIRKLHSIKHQLPAVIKAAIFDFDGTLFDTEAHGTQCLINAVSQQKQITLSDAEQYELYLQCLGRSLNDILALICHRFELSFDQLLDDYRDIWCTNLRTDFAIRDSIECAKQLHASGMPIAICTGSESHQINPILEQHQLQHIFSHHVTAEHYPQGQGKPHPAPYCLSLQQLNLRPEQVIVFEDSVHGVQSAKAAGIECIVALSDKPHQTDNLIAAGASHVTSSLLKYPQSSNMQPVPDGCAAKI